MTNGIGWGLVLGLLLCPAAEAAAAKPAKPAPPAPVDRVALAEQVRATEMAFAKTVTDDRIDLFESYLDPEAVFVSGKTVTRGKAAVVEAWRGSFGPDRPYFVWSPEIVEVSADGNVALSRGTWTTRVPAKRGKLQEISGTFNSIWRRQADGSWKIAFDAGCSPCPDCR